MSEGKEYFKHEDIDVLIEFNRRLMERRGNFHAASYSELERILVTGLDQFRSITNHRDRILNMAAWIMYEITEKNTFYDGRKNSARAMAIRFLTWNGYSLPQTSNSQKVELFRILTGIQKHRVGLKDVREYLYRATITF